MVHRSDGSGTTWIFTSYLNKVSNAWKNNVGHAKAVAWPIGVGCKGNQGVALYVGRIKGSIGYVEYAYALQNDMTYVKLRNRAGTVVATNVKIFQNAASYAHWKKAPGFYDVLTNQPGAKSWPIMGASFNLMYRQQKRPATASSILKFFNWAYENGDQKVTKLDYVPRPENVVKLVRDKWHRQLSGPVGESLWPTK